MQIAAFSLLIPVYGQASAQHLSEALQSVDEQTYPPEQIVIVEDGPLTAELQAVLAHWQAVWQGRLQCIALPVNQGVGAALNAGLAACKHELVARLDADDVAVADRFAQQVEFMQAHPRVAAVGGWIEEWDETFSVCLGVRVLPECSAAIRRLAQVRCPLSHSASMLRRSAVLAVGGYPALRSAEDFWLWTALLLQGFELANLQKVLVRVRAGEALLARRNSAFLKGERALLNFQLQQGFISRRRWLVNLLGKSLLRIAPLPIKKVCYRKLRKHNANQDDR